MKIKALKAFTLIELIVVIAIIGVLAAVLIPSLAGYIQESRTATANANAKLVYNNGTIIATALAVGGHVMTVDGATGNIIYSGIIPKKPDAPVDVKSFDDLSEEEFEKCLADMMGGNADGAVGWYKIEFDSNGNTHNAWWAKSENDTFVGSWPNPRTIEDNSGSDTIDDVGN
jgi:type IV pilus assembly protein PilA